MFRKKIKYRYVRDVICRQKYSSPSAENSRILIRPYLDFDVLFQDADALKTNIKRRNINSVSVDRLNRLWSDFKKFVLHKQELEATVTSLQTKLDNSSEEEETEAGNSQRYKIAENELINVSSRMYELEEAVVPDCLALPNKLHPDTPDESDVTIHSSSPDEKVNTATHHLVVGEKMSLLEYRNPVCFFLLDEAAIFEIAVLKFFAVELEKFSYLQFCNPDIVTSLTVEGCGYDSRNPYETLILEGGERHLVGAASLFPFCAFYARHSVNCKYIPERRFCIGRKYVPPSDENHDGLYTAVQKSCAYIFHAISNSLDDQTTEFNAVISRIKSLYDKIGLNYRLVYVKAAQLQRNESLRVSIQLYSPYRQLFVEVGHVSFYDDYISRRLFMYYHKWKDHYFLHILSGVLVDVPVLIACLLEYSESANSLLIPDCIKEHMIDKNDYN